MNLSLHIQDIQKTISNERKLISDLAREHEQTLGRIKKSQNNNDVFVQAAVNQDKKIATDIAQKIMEKQNLIEALETKKSNYEKVLNSPTIKDISIAVKSLLKRYGEAHFDRAGNIFKIEESGIELSDYLFDRKPTIHWSVISQKGKTWSNSLYVTDTRISVILSFDEDFQPIRFVVVGMEKKECNPNIESLQNALVDTIPPKYRYHS